MVAEDNADTVVIGGFGVLWKWTTELLSEICYHAVPPIALANGGRDSDVGDIGVAGGRPRLLLIRRPDERVADAVATRRVRVVAIIDDPVDCVRMTMKERNCDAADALREQTASAAIHHLCLDNPRVFILKRGTTASARDIANKLLAQIKADIPLETLEPILLQLTGGRGEELSLEAALKQQADYVPLHQIASAVTPDDAQMTRQALSPLIQGAIRAEAATVTWPARALFFGDQPGNAPPPIIDLTGTTRTILYGPYFHLPPGKWRVTISFAVTHPARDHQFQLNFFCALRPIARAMLKPSSAGAFVGTMLIDHRNSTHSLEINLVSLQGMIEGRFSFGVLTFEYIGS